MELWPEPLISWNGPEAGAALKPTHDHVLYDQVLEPELWHQSQISWNGPKAGADLKQLSALQHSNDEASFPQLLDREMLYDHVLKPELWLEPHISWNGPKAGAVLKVPEY